MKEIITLIEFLRSGKDLSKFPNIKKLTSLEEIELRKVHFSLDNDNGDLLIFEPRANTRMTHSYDHKYDSFMIKGKIQLDTNKIYFDEVNSNAELVFCEEDFKPNQPNLYKFS